MKQKTNQLLKPLNTLQFESKARELVELETIEDLFEYTQTQTKLPDLILGEGSNLLITKDCIELVVKIGFKGIKIVKETEDSVLLRVFSGENWHDLVKYVVGKNWGGIENLALIPGLVGAAPVQNIAAYGQNFSDVVESVEYFDWHSRELITLSPDECRFGYRDSIFKRELKGRAIITQVLIKLAKNPGTETSYYSIGGLNDSLDKELSESATAPYSIKDIFDAVVAIRKRKMPDWKTTPTVGSFFINPIVNQAKLAELEAKIPQLQSYPVEQLRYSGNSTIAKGLVKIPVGRILDYLGWRGKSVGNCLVTKENAAIFSHSGKATGKEFYQFTQEIKNDVLDQLGIELETEVVVI